MWGKIIGVLFGEVGALRAFMVLLIPLYVLWGAVLLFNIFDKKIDRTIERQHSELD